MFTKESFKLTYKIIKPVDIWPGKRNGYEVDVYDGEEKLHTMPYASKIEIDLLLCLQELFPPVKEGLNIEDFNFDNKAFELYKKGKHPAQTDYIPENLLKLIELYGEGKYEQGSYDEAMSNAGPEI